MSDQPRTSVARLRVIDLETTGDSFSNGGVVEVGWQDLEAGADGRWVLAGAPGARLVDPGCAISPATSAVHHIVDEDVAGAARWDDVAADLLRPAGVRALAAHRAAFEKRWCLPRLTGGARWICTYKCALRLWPDAPTHSNQGLRYWRRPAGLDRAAGLPAHRAGPDAYVTAHHLRDMLARASVEQLLAWSEQPALLVRVPHGALRGRSWQELDDAQLDQVLDGQWGQNQDMMFTAREADPRHVDRGAGDRDDATGREGFAQVEVGRERVADGRCHDRVDRGPSVSAMPVRISVGAARGRRPGSPPTRCCSPPGSWCG